MCIVSSDGRLCAASSLDRIIRVYEVASGEQVERIRSHSDSVYSVAFSPCGNYLASGSLDKTVKVFDLGGTHERVKKHLAGGKLEQGGAVCMFTLLGHKVGGAETFHPYICCQAVDWASFYRITCYRPDGLPMGNISFQDQRTDPSWSGILRLSCHIA